MDTVAIWLIVWIACSLLTAALFTRWASASKQGGRRAGVARPIRGSKPGLHNPGAHASTHR